MKPVGPRVLVKVEAKKEATVSGIIMTKQIEEPSLKGVVTEVGSGDKKLKGKTIVYPKYGFDEVSHEGTTYHIVKEDDIIATL